MRKKQRSPAGRLSAAVMVFYLLAFLLLALRSGSMEGLILAVTVPVMIWVGTYLFPRVFPADQLLLTLTNFLCALGVLTLYAANSAYVFHHLIAYGVGLMAMLFCIYLVRSSQAWGKLIWFLMLLSLLLLMFPVFFGRETNGAKNWLDLGILSFQPSEMVKLSLVLTLAWFMSRRRFLPWVIFAALCLALLMLQKDLGTALLYFSTALLLYWASTGNWLVTGLGLAGGCAAAWWGYTMFAHVRLRVSVWLNPWKDGYNAGYQLIQGLVALASGGLFGVGLGLGNPTAIPVYESDYIFAVICEQFGLIIGCCVLLIYVALIWRGTSIARSARSSFHGLLAMGCTIFLGIQTILIIGGVLKLIPLTGVTMPFVSYGGTSMVSSLCMIGLMSGVSSLNEDALEEDTHLAMLAR